MVCGKLAFSIPGNDDLRVDAPLQIPWGLFDVHRETIGLMQHKHPFSAFLKKGATSLTNPLQFEAQLPMRPVVTLEDLESVANAA